MMKDQTNYDDLLISKVKFNSKNNLTEILHPEFLKELKEEFKEVKCVNIVLNTSETEIPHILVISHGNDDELSNKIVTAELSSVGSLKTDEPLKKIIKVMKE